jgi:uncharacterized membrane protein YdjX (TVP38/TMEM64 family)
MAAERNDPSRTGSGRTALRRWLPLVVIVAAMALVFGMGWQHYISFRTVGTNYQALQEAIAANLALAVLAYVLLYILVVSLSLPGGLVLTVTGGLLFGWFTGTLATIVGATIGATIIFLIARSSLGEALAARAGPWLAKLREGFKEDALSYLLFLRLVPLFPFWLINLAPAVLGVPLRTYIIATAIGIVPGTLAFSVAGSGLGSVVEAQNASYAACLASQSVNPDVACPYTIDPSALITKELLVALALLGLVALIPIAYKKWSKGNVGT